MAAVTVYGSNLSIMSIAAFISLLELKHFSIPSAIAVSSTSSSSSINCRMSLSKGSNNASCSSSVVLSCLLSPFVPAGNL